MKLRQGYILGFMLAALGGIPVAFGFGFLGTTAATASAVAYCLIVLALDGCLQAVDRREDDGSDQYPPVHTGYGLPESTTPNVHQ